MRNYILKEFSTLFVKLPLIFFQAGLGSATCSRGSLWLEKMGGRGGRGALRAAKLQRLQVDPPDRYLANWDQSLPKLNIWACKEQLYG